MSVTRYRQPSHVGSATAPVGTGSHEETASIKEPIQQSRIKSASEAWPIFSGYSPEAQQTIKIVYDEIRHYHGTSAVSKKGIQRDGFDTNKKTAGSTVAYLNSEETSEMREKATQEDVDNFVLNAATHNYVTPDKDEAKSYAKLADGNHPALVRVGLGDNTVSLEPDPDLLDVVDPDDRDGMGYRTKDSIPSKYVFSSKSKDLSNLDGNVSNSLYSLFQTELENNGITVSKEDVPFLFQEVQSDSENDFDSENGSVFAH
ncbi:hypothetical protein ASE07_26945 [Noviherbaspirillum sp. Root189]|nr:hypothetical protein ASE07_26945 [Noviherbaspirillum sp. Root189]